MLKHFNIVENLSFSIFFKMTNSICIFGFNMQKSIIAKKITCYSGVKWGQLEVTSTSAAWTLPPGWAHYVLNFLGPAVGYDLYVNGAFEAQDRGKGSKTYSPEDGRITVGRGCVTCEQKYIGLDVDELMIFNSSLTAAQIMQLKNTTIDWIAMECAVKIYLNDE